MLHHIEHRRGVQSPRWQVDHEAARQVAMHEGDRGQLRNAAELRPLGRAVAVHAAHSTAQILAVNGRHTPAAGGEVGVAVDPEHSQQGDRAGIGGDANLPKAHGAHELGLRVYPPGIKVARDSRDLLAKEGAEHRAAQELAHVAQARHVAKVRGHLGLRGQQLGPHHALPRELAKGERVVGVARGGDDDQP